ncbi:hypothetical protein IC582_011834 [Cucumis melo]|nr:uncharacterized protein LOC103496651 [Cucumis melo]KAA0063545.1 uncharacterized protein E6C27_scaffold329G00510 [Cucumis melo var. makuwa]TYJ97872.1 uncharacterized protein E5676_scaffold285G00850 [Cucumis melo var. makuwa]
MATVILPPQDCLGKGLRHQGLVLSAPLNSRRNSNPNSASTSSNPNFNHDDKSCSGRRRRSASVGLKANRQANRERSRVRESSTTAKMTTKSLVMGQVKILKRGEILTPGRGVGGGGGGGDSCGKRRLESKVEEVDLVLGSTDRLGPDPDLMQKQVVLTEFKDGMYAGSGAFFASPPPSSVPLPSFVVKNGIATTDLRRLLRLDLE